MVCASWEKGLSLEKEGLPAAGLDQRPQGGRGREGVP